MEPLTFESFMEMLEPNKVTKEIELENGKKVMAKGPDGTYSVLGETFTSEEMSDASDMAHTLDNWDFLNPENHEHLSNFLMTDGDEPWTIGQRLLFSLFITPHDCGVYLLEEDDVRLINICKKRVKNQQAGLDIDSDLIV